MLWRHLGQTAASHGAPHFGVGELGVEKLRLYGVVSDGAVIEWVFTLAKRHPLHQRVPPNISKMVPCSPGMLLFELVLLKVVTDH